MPANTSIPSRPGRRTAWARRGWPAGWSLRARLLAALIALLTVVCLIIGVVTVTALNSFLLDQLDRQLQAAGGRSVGALGRPPQEPGQGRESRESPQSGRQSREGPGLGFLQAPGQAAGTFGAHIAGGRVDAAVLDDSGTLRQVPTARGALADLPVNGRPHTREVGGLGEYRLLARRAPDGDVVVTGLPLRDLHATLYRLIAVVILVAVAGLLAATVLGAVIVRLTLRPLRRVAATAGRVADLPLDRGEVALAERVPEADTDPRTEVGQVGTALNRMLGHIAAALAARHASETRVRRFVADASHELRTPLAAIRGYAELTRRGHEPVPPEVAHAMTRVESEATRMTALVEDLLLLARLDRGRPPATEPVDLSRLLVDAAADAHAAGPGHRWRLDLPEEPVMTVGDAAHLHQVVTNLLANARTHTPPGTTVTASLTTDAGQALLRVADDGPGIPADLLPEVFERFARGDTSRSRTAGGTGLGLAIVAAVVAAHHGSVQVRSESGRTVFTVLLPARSA
jgi:two-component system OmpR family sensor kinase